jgi:hypothetical protein
MFLLLNAGFALIYAYLHSLATPKLNSVGRVDSVAVELNGKNLTAYIFDIGNLLVFIVSLHWMGRHASLALL